MCGWPPDASASVEANRAEQVRLEPLVDRRIERHRGGAVHHDVDVPGEGREVPFQVPVEDFDALRQDPGDALLAHAVAKDAERGPAHQRLDPLAARGPELGSDQEGHPRVGEVQQQALEHGLPQEPRDPGDQRVPTGQAPDDRGLGGAPASFRAARHLYHSADYDPLPFGRQVPRVAFPPMDRGPGGEGSDVSRPPPWREVFQGKLGRLTAGLLLLEALVAVEALVVTTILPAVRRDLGGIQFYGWAFSATFLATFASIPIAGRATDRYGPRRPLAIMLGVYVVGLVIAGLAPTMLVLVIGRFVQGCGAGAFYSVSLGTVAKSYPGRIRPRVLALLASMWILPGILGPPLGALLASTVGWRWVFVAPLPLLVVIAVLILPAMPDVTGDAQAGGLSIRWPVQLMVGAGLFLAGLTEPSWWSLAMIPAGLVLGLPALARIAPPAGSGPGRAFRQRPRPHSCCRRHSSPWTASSH